MRSIVANVLVLVTIIGAVVAAALSPRPWDPDPNNAMAGVGDWITCAFTVVYVLAILRYRAVRGALGLLVLDGALAFLFLAGAVVALQDGSTAGMAVCLFLALAAVIGWGAIIAGGPRRHRRGTRRPAAAHR